MGFWDTLKGHAKAQFLDVIEWLDSSSNILVYRYPVFNQAIQDGGKLVVREGQAAVFITEGKLSDVFGPGTYTLSTNTEALWSFFQSIKYQFNYPYKGDIYYVSTRQNTNQKWGTANPFMMRDPEIGPVRLRAFGIYAYRITDPAQFLREVVGTDGLFTTDEINGQLKRKLVSAFIDAVASLKMPVLDLATQYMDLGEALANQISPWFEEHYGITLTDFTIENISLPPKVEEMLDKRSQMGLLGNLNAYTQFQSANAIEAAAGQSGGGGLGASMMSAGVGLAMGNVVANQMAGSMGHPGQQPYNPHMSPPAAPGTAPPPAPAPQIFHYSGPSGQQQLNAADVARQIAAAPGGKHHVWAPGWAGWKSWNEVPEIAGLVPPPAPSGGGGGPPPPPAQ
jgi:membrane protease subunit (stomatin/prohibitin family)